MRALLTCYADQFAQAGVRHLVDELEWLMSRLGESLTLEVAQAYIESLPVADDPEALTFLARLSQSRQFAVWDLGATCVSRRYVDALDLIASPGASLEWTGRADSPWRAELVPDLRQAYAALQHADRRAHRAGADSIDEALGAVRSRVRTLQYATEAVESLDRPRYSPLVGRMVSARAVLDAHHDAVAVERVLARGSRIIQGSAAKRWLKEARSLVAVAKADAVGDWHRERHLLAAFTF